ncbi:2-iminobutanoate/2-iminopropanoate deaminase [Breoghania corrubedonensis]|uniref:2-iminobutanoate/2-iminopropanoate deaminase n=1 Tax=Breoghania corrubedonensis TaxID=665038 RepID=A0A2T5VA00_9HYPH|nr:RidA family protein [Breoghania corrubedonensis]PTW60551.1 2-iminobutanoate/2-iminopropanoate deaminase [Breoghania corrubedonensis]
MLPVDTSNAPGAVGPYSQAIRTGNLLFVSGQLPIDPATGAFAPGGAVEQARQSLKNIAAIAQAAGTDMARCVKTTVLLTDLGVFGAVNEEYATFFQAPFPARACYEVAALPKGALVEIEAVFEV